MTKYVLDASAILALLGKEPGANRIEQAILGGAVATSAVNLAEVVGKLGEAGLSEQLIRDILGPLVGVVVPFDENLAYQTGLLRARTKHLGLSIGDRACLALASAGQSIALTCDRTWSQLEIGVDIEIAR